jgi:hypothetical protein
MIRMISASLGTLRKPQNAFLRYRTSPTTFLLLADHVNDLIGMDLP